MASYLTTVFLAERYPQDARIWRTVTTPFREHLAPPTSRPRFAGDVHVGAMVDSYMIYLGSLQARVNEVFRHERAEFLGTLRAVWQQQAGAGTLRILERASPGFQKWAGERHRM